MEQDGILKRVVLFLVTTNLQTQGEALDKMVSRCCLLCQRFLYVPRTISLSALSDPAF